MSIKKLITDAPKLSEIELKWGLAERSQMHGFNELTYKTLLPITMLAAQNEQSDLPIEQQKETARANAAKLSILFSNADQAINYLERYEKRYPQSKQIIHDACLYTLSDGNKWDVKLWRDIVMYHTPNSPEDLVIRLLPFADKIEKYVHEHRDEIQQKIKEEIVRSYEQKFSEQYDNIAGGQTEKQQKNLIELRLSERSKTIQRATETKFDKDLREKLNFPIGKNIRLDEEQRKKIREMKESPEGKKLFIDIKSKVQEEERKKIVSNIFQEVTKLGNQDKSSYLTEKIHSLEDTINSAVKTRMQSILSKNTPLNELSNYARHFMYARAAENTEAAELFYNFGITETNFDKYLELKPFDDTKHIPDVTIDGRQLSNSNPDYQQYYIKKLNPFDPRAALLGKMTSCCQSIGAEGEGPAIHGITDPRGGFYVLCKKPDTIVSQCWAWRSKEGCIIFDSTESQIDFRKNELLISDFYTKLATDLVENHQVPRVLVGTGGETPKKCGVMTALLPSRPVNYRGYGDSWRQRLLADHSLPLLQVYKEKNPESVLIPYPLTGMNAEKIKEWSDLCAINKMPGKLSLVEPYLEIAGITKDEIQTRYLILDKYITLCGASTINWDDLKKLIEIQGVNPNYFTEDYPFILFRTIQPERLDMLEWLVDHGADIHIAEKPPTWGSYLVLTAARCRAWEIVKWLIIREKSLNINVLDNYQESLLSYAIMDGNLDNVKFLVAHGADIHQLFLFDTNALDRALGNVFASDKIHPDIAEWLLNQGAYSKPGIKSGCCVAECAKDGKLTLVVRLVELGFYPGLYPSEIKDSKLVKSLLEAQELFIGKMIAYQQAELMINLSEKNPAVAERIRARFEHALETSSGKKLKEVIKDIEQQLDGFLNQTETKKNSLSFFTSSTTKLDQLSSKTRQLLLSSNSDRSQWTSMLSNYYNEIYTFSQSALAGHKINSPIKSRR